MFCHVTLPVCFERFDWSLAIDYLVSTNMASFLWTFEDEKCNTSNVILCPAELPNFWYKLLMLTMSAYCFSHAFHSYDICQEFEKRELAELFQITCPCRRSLVVIKGCENFPSLKLYVIRMSLSTVSVLLHLDSWTLKL